MSAIRSVNFLCFSLDLNVILYYLKLFCHSFKNKKIFVSALNNLFEFETPGLVEQVGLCCCILVLVVLVVLGCSLVVVHSVKGWRTALKVS